MAENMSGRSTRSISDRFWEKVHKSDDGCWEWVACKNYGYGIFRDRSRQKSINAHRIAYELTVGPIPDGMQVDHLCRNRGCVNPAHLEVVTQTENLMRGDGPAARNARKTHCKRGHEFTPDNTRWRDGGSRRKNPSRRCYICVHEYSLNRNRKNGTAAAARSA